LWLLLEDDTRHAVCTIRWTESVRAAHNLKNFNEPAERRDFIITETEEVFLTDGMSEKAEDKFQDGC
jgi:hypothetical protein